MLSVVGLSRDLLVHQLAPAGPIPPIEDPDGIYPYESYCETSRVPSLKTYTFVRLENRFLSVEVCPDLGGKVWSIFDKRANTEVLYQPGVIRPARILPRMAFSSGGIEVSFPVSHSPVLLEPLHYELSRNGDRVSVSCGEQEYRYGLQWTVEYSLGESDTFLVQRTLLSNPTTVAREYLSWSCAALPARRDSECWFPSGRVLMHSDRLKEIHWPVGQPRLIGEFDRMAGFFWIDPSVHAFGAYTPSLGTGLYHVADPADAPGIKLWVYGSGADERWAYLSGRRTESYFEIQAGVNHDQATKERLLPGERALRTEYWIPTSTRLVLDEIAVPRVSLADTIPTFGWVPREKTRVWIELRSVHRENDPNRLPAPPAWHSNQWPPSGMADLGEAIAWALESTSENGERELWRYYLSVWLAARGGRDSALNLLGSVTLDCARVLEARLVRRWLADFRRAARLFESIAAPEVALHPQVVIERDIALSAAGSEFLEARKSWLDQVDLLIDDGVYERYVTWLVDVGRAADAMSALRSRIFEPIHQRYVRTHLWERIQRELGEGPTTPPESLGEDRLAEYGAYRSE